MAKAKQTANLLFRAFSDATRLRILYLLREGELCVGDLVTIIRVPQPTASRHLAYLRRSGLVKPRNHGAWTFYSVAPARGVFHRKLLECLEHCFEEVAELKADAVRARRVRESGGCCPR